MNGGISQMARVLESLNRLTPNQAWLANAGRVMDANRERWTAEVAENERIASRDDGVGQ